MHDIQNVRLYGLITRYKQRDINVHKSFIIEEHLELLQLIFTIHLHLHHHIQTLLLGDQQV